MIALGRLITIDTSPRWRRKKKDGRGADDGATGQQASMAIESSPARVICAKTLSRMPRADGDEKQSRQRR